MMELEPCGSVHDLVFISSIPDQYRMRVCVRCDYTEPEEPEPNACE